MSAALEAELEHAELQLGRATKEHTLAENERSELKAQLSRQERSEKTAMAQLQGQLEGVQNDFKEAAAQRNALQTDAAVRDVARRASEESLTKFRELSLAEAKVAESRASDALKLEGMLTVARDSHANASKELQSRLDRTELDASQASKLRAEVQKLEADLTRAKQISVTQQAAPPPDSKDTELARQRAIEIVGLNADLKKSVVQIADLTKERDDAKTALGKKAKEFGDMETKALEQIKKQQALLDELDRNGQEAHSLLAEAPIPGQDRTMQVQALAEARKRLVQGMQSAFLDLNDSALLDLDEESLPEGWEKFEDEQGQTYYHCHATNETSWEPPPKPVLPAGWEKLKTDEGATYYHKDETNETRWDFPA